VKARQYNLVLEESCDLLPRFYDLYLQGMQRLGTPHHPYAFFEQILEKFPEHVKILMVLYKSEYIAGAYLFSYKRSLYNLWAAWDTRYRKQCPNNFLYWEMLRYARDHNFENLDLGRSATRSSVAAFKKQWVPEVHPLYYQFYFPGTKRRSVTGVEKYEYAAHIWKRLPRRVTKIIGPRLRKYVY